MNTSRIRIHWFFFVKLKHFLPISNSWSTPSIRTSSCCSSKTACLHLALIMLWFKLFKHSKTLPSPILQFFWIAFLQFLNIFGFKLMLECFCNNWNCNCFRQLLDKVLGSFSVKMSFRAISLKQATTSALVLISVGQFCTISALQDSLNLNENLKIK